MTGIPTQIFGGTNPVTVTSRGQLITAPFAFDQVVAKTLTSAGVALNFYPPKVSQCFVVTGILLTADKQVNQDVLVDVYEGTTVSETTIDRAILHVEMLKNSGRDITNLNILIREGKWVNAKADDADVFVTIMGYYVPVEPR